MDQGWEKIAMKKKKLTLVTPSIITKIVFFKTLKS